MTSRSSFLSPKTLSLSPKSPSPVPRPHGTLWSHSGVTMGTPRATAQRNLTVRRTRSVTRWVQSKTEVAMDPPSVFRATSMSGEATTPVNST